MCVIQHYDAYSYMKRADDRSDPLGYVEVAERCSVLTNIRNAKTCELLELGKIRAHYTGREST